MTTSDDMELTDRRSPDRRTGPHSHGNISDHVISDSYLLGKRQHNGKAKTRTRNRKRSANSATRYEDLPCPWDQSQHELMKDKENADLLQRYGTQSGLHLPNIGKRHGLSLRERNKHQPVFTVQKSPAHPGFGFPNIPKSATPRVPPKSPRAPIILPPATSPRDFPPGKMSRGACDPARESHDNSRDYRESPPDVLPPIPKFRMTTLSSSPDSTDNGNLPQRHLSPFSRKPTS